MKMVRGVGGFTLIEVMIVSFVMALVIMASSEATLYFIKQLKRTERAQEALGEVQELDMYVRRSSKNLNRSRLNMPTTFYQSPSTGLQSLGVNSNTPASSLTISRIQWMDSGASNPLYSQAMAAFPQATYDVVLDSFTLEEHSLVTINGGLEKRTKRLLVSRCDKLDKIFNLRDVVGAPGVTAFYVLGAMNRRPFLSYRNNGQAQLNCCPPENPQCSDGGIQFNFFRSYVITLNENQSVSGVEEFPKARDDNPVVGGGFGLYFMSADGASVSIQTFSMINSCNLKAGFSSEICQSRVNLSTLLSFSNQYPGLIKVDTKGLSTSVSNDILKTGVISL
ncbi:type II secretion system protein J [Bdellovibrio bacteriovorus]|uniref:PulJ/GspJ family protein n=1 Tax=Bdellovibrio TaxID=958 RepID=UPI0035A974E2